MTHIGKGSYHVLSGAATNAIEGWTAYCSTKAALHMINQQTHVEGKKDFIKSIGISPGMVDTKMQGQIRQRLESRADSPSPMSKYWRRGSS